MEKLITALRVFIVYALLLGILYPLGITGIGYLLMASKANGSLIYKNDQIVGSALIAQEFTEPKYFHSRFSAVNYSGNNSGASNLSPSSQALMDKTASYIKKVRLENNLSANIEIPADMVLESASGLDPHISYENALLQVKRVATARHISEDTIKNLIDENTDLDFIGIWGQDAVNVLQLNLALDTLKKTINN